MLTMLSHQSLLSIKFNIMSQEYNKTIYIILQNWGMRQAHSDILELTEDNPTIILGSKIDSMDNDDEEVPPFYMSLNIHGMVLHNAMLD